jgi:2-amino-4-hydroxy-6-hydroxymethyldihydropteridine diphosphokinase
LRVELELVDAIVGLGSNLEPARHLPAAIRLLAAAAEVTHVSSAWSTAPVGPPGQLPFVNAAVRLRTALPAQQLKHELLRDVERRLGRVRSADRFAPRPIDLDLVLYGDHSISLDGRKIPEPELLSHAHVALPASEVAPRWVHPDTGETLAAIAERLIGQLPVEERPQRLALRLGGQKNRRPVDRSTGRSRD